MLVLMLVLVLVLVLMVVRQVFVLMFSLRKLLKENVGICGAQTYLSQDTMIIMFHYLLLPAPLLLRGVW